MDPKDAVVIGDVNDPKVKEARKKARYRSMSCIQPYVHIYIYVYTVCLYVYYVDISYLSTCPEIVRRLYMSMFMSSQML